MNESICKVCKKNFNYWPSHAKGIYCCKQCEGLDKRGKNHPNWKGGVTPIRQLDSHIWVKKAAEILKRDNYKCVECGYKNHTSGKYCVVHHIKTWAEYPELRFENSNLITLCQECHWKAHSIDGTVKRFIWKKKPKKARYFACLYCGKEKKAIPYRIMEGNCKYCSRKCMGLHRKETGSFRGINSPSFGRKHTLEAKLKISAKRKLYLHSLTL